MTARRTSPLGRSIPSDRRGIQCALALARYGAATVAPNPAVGAIVVKEGKVVGYGWHRQAGGDHAEVEALRMAGPLARGATLFVTLEPCNHHGKTPPCTEAILAAGVARVVVGIADPNPLVAGGGSNALAAHGVEVCWCDRAESIVDLDLDWLTRVAAKGRPAISWWLPLCLDGSVGDLRECYELFASTAGRRRAGRFVSLGGTIAVPKDAVASIQALLSESASAVVGWEGDLDGGLSRLSERGARHVALVGGEWVTALKPRADQVDKLVVIHLPQWGGGAVYDWPARLTLERAYRADRFALSVFRTQRGE